MWPRYEATDLTLCSKWRYAFAGGEPLANGLFEEFQKTWFAWASFQYLRAWEITVASTRIEISYNGMTSEEPIPADLVLPNYSVCIIDEQLKAVPVELSGEIVIGGVGVSS